MCQSQPHRTKRWRNTIWMDWVSCPCLLGFFSSSSSSSSTSCSSSSSCSSLGALCYPSLKVLMSSWTWAQGLSSEQSLRTSLICMWPQCKFDRKWEIKRWNTLRDELAVSRKSQFDLDCAAIQSENRVAACEEVTLPQFEVALHKNVKRQRRYSTSRRTIRWHLRWSQPGTAKLSLILHWELASFQQTSTTVPLHTLGWTFNQSEDEESD